MISVRVMKFLVRCLVIKIKIHYSNTFVKWPLCKRPKIGFQAQLSLNAGQKNCRKGEHSAILSTFIKLPFVMKIFLLKDLNDNFIIDLCSCCQAWGHISSGTVNFSTISTLKTWSIVQETQQCSFIQTEMARGLYL